MQAAAVKYTSRGLTKAKSSNAAKKKGRLCIFAWYSSGHRTHGRVYGPPMASKKHLFKKHQAAKWGGGKERWFCRKNDFTPTK